MTIANGGNESCVYKFAELLNDIYIIFIFCMFAVVQTISYINAVTSYQTQTMSWLFTVGFDVKYYNFIL